jgi:hypothetical protein
LIPPSPGEKINDNDVIKKHLFLNNPIPRNGELQKVTRNFNLELEQVNSVGISIQSDRESTIPDIDTNIELGIEKEVKPDNPVK